MQFFSLPGYTAAIGWPTGLWNCQEIFWQNLRTDLYTECFRDGGVTSFVPCLYLVVPTSNSFLSQRRICTLLHCGSPLNSSDDDDLWSPSLPRSLPNSFFIFPTWLRPRSSGFTPGLGLGWVRLKERIKSARAPAQARDSPRSSRSLVSPQRAPCCNGHARCYAFLFVTCGHARQVYDSRLGNKYWEKVQAWSRLQVCFNGRPQKKMWSASNCYTLLFHWS